MSKRLTINVLLLSLTIIALLFNSSCSSKRKMTESSLRSFSANNLIREVEENKFEFDNFQSKLDIKFNDGKKTMSLKGQLRMQKDSVIWVTLTFMGIEAARLMITTDSINFINRNDRTYLSEDLGKIKEFMPIEPSLSFVQDILTGNERLRQKDEKYKISTVEGKYKLETRKEEKDMVMTKDIWVMPENFRISKYDIRNHQTETKLEYDDFEYFGDSYLPTKISLTHSSGNVVSIEIEYSNVAIGKELTFPFKINKKYDRINVWQ